MLLRMCACVCVRVCVDQLVRVDVVGCLVLCLLWFAPCVRVIACLCVCAFDSVCVLVTVCGCVCARLLVSRACVGRLECGLG